MDKKAHIIKVATALFQQKGYIGVGLNELLSACGCSRGAFYHHFPLGKEQLLLTCLAQLRDYIAEDCNAIFERHERPLLAVQAIIKKLMDDYDRSGTIVGYTFTSIVSELGAVSEQVRMACDALYDDLARIMAAHLERAGYEKRVAEERALFIVAAIEGAVMLTLTKKSILPLKIIYHQIEQNLETR